MQYTHPRACIHAHAHFCSPSVSHTHRHSTLDRTLHVSISPWNLGIFFEVSLTWFKGVYEMAQRVKVLATKHDVLSSIPRSSYMRGETVTLEVSSDLHMRVVTICIHTDNSLAN